MGKREREKEMKSVHRIAGMTAGAHPSTYLIPYDRSWQTYTELLARLISLAYFT